MRPTPEQFLSGFPPAIEDLAQRLRRLVAHAVPSATEAVYPGWRLIGYRVRAGRRDAYFGFVAPFVDRVLLGFEYGILLSDPSHLLEGDGKQVRHVTIRRAQDIRPKEVAALIAEAARIAVAPKREKVRLLLGGGRAAPEPGHARMSREGHRMLRFTAAALALVAGGAAITGHAAADDVLVVGAFSSAPEGPDPPPGWKPLTFKKVPTRTAYAVVLDRHVAREPRRARTAVRAYHCAVSIVRVRPGQGRVLQEGQVQGWPAPVRRHPHRRDQLHLGPSDAAGHDRALRVHRLRQDDRDIEPRRVVVASFLGHVAFGDDVLDLPPPRDDGILLEVVVESGDANVGRWMEEERNLYEDYRRAFGEEPLPVNGVAIMGKSHLLHSFLCDSF